MTTVTVQTTTPEMEILNAQKLEELCKVPVAIGTVLSLIGTLPVHIIGMFVVLTKLENVFNPSRIAATLRQKKAIGRS